jgi:hypothetical protein
MQNKFLHLIAQAQNVALCLFTENAANSSQAPNYYTGSRCGTYNRMHAKNKNILFH